MRLVWLSVGQFRSVDAQLPIRPITVLFGPNGSGKTNLLDALELGFGQTHALPRPDPDRPIKPWELGDDYPLELFAVLELDGIGIADHPDERLFREIAQYDDPQLVPGGESVPASRRKRATYRFNGVEERPPVEPMSSADLKRWLRSKIMPEEQEYAKARKVFDDMGTVVDACLDHRMFLYRPMTGWVWLTPLPRMLTPDQRDAALRFASAVPDLESHSAGYLGLVNRVANSPDSAEIAFFMEYDLESPRGVQPFRIVRLGAAEALSSEVSSAVATAIVASRARTRRLRYLVKEDVERFDPWLQRARIGGSVRLHPEVRAFLSDVSHRANELRPAFLSDYEIEVVSGWPAETADAIGIKLRFAGQLFDLSVVGSGTAVWAAYAVLEALREQATEDSTASDEESSDWVTDGELMGATPFADIVVTTPSNLFVVDGNSDEPAPMTTTMIEPPEQLTFYLVDEPERHLHPMAQEEVAEWLARRASGGRIQMIVASHSPAFLDIPQEDVEYVSVFRDHAGTTRVASLTEDLLHALAHYAPELGTTPAQRVQLTRAVLLVEGEHDKRVIEAFYGKALRRQRVRVQPIRGTSNARAILEAETLVALGVPLFLMLDAVRVEVITGEREPQTQEEHRIVKLRPLWAQRHRASKLEILPFPLPDIFAALPDEVIWSAVRAAGVPSKWPGQRATLDRWSQAGNPSNYKRFLLDAAGLGEDADEQLSVMLEHADPSMRCQPDLDRAMQSLLAQVRPRYISSTPPK